MLLFFVGFQPLTQKPQTDFYSHNQAKYNKIRIFFVTLNNYAIFAPQPPSQNSRFIRL